MGRNGRLLIVSHSVDDAKLATSKIVSSLMPAFRPSYTMHNGTRIYNLIPDKVSLVKYGEDISTDEAGTTTPSEGGSTDGGNEEEPPVLGGEDEGGSGGTGTDEPDITVGEEEGGEIGE